MPSGSPDAASVDQTALDPAAFALDGKTVIVTGGGRGLGQGIALSAAMCGADVIAVARSINQLEETKDLASDLGREMRIMSADLSESADLPGLVNRLWRDHGPIYGIVHAAGVQVRKPAIDVTPDDWTFVHAINTTAPFFMSTTLARLQIENQYAGSHLMVGSLNSTIGLANVAPYAASKTALLGMARVMSTEWAQHGIRTNVIGPGYFATELTKDLLSEDSNRQRILSRIPMRSLGAAKDVGAVAVFLLSDASRYITGQLINVDGGWLSS